MPRKCKSDISLTPDKVRIWEVSRSRQGTDSNNLLLGDRWPRSHRHCPFFKGHRRRSALLALIPIWPSQRTCVYLLLWWSWRFLVPMRGAR